MNKRIYIFFLFFSLVVAAQKPVVTSIDKKKNKIGAQFNLTLKVTADTASVVTFPKSKMFGALEVIRDYKVDTVKKDDKYELIKKYGLTQFDSGKYTIPSLKVLIDKKEFKTDSIRIEVANVAVDTLKQKMYDIKDIDKSGSDSFPWWIIAVIAVCIGALIYFVPKLIKRFRKPKESIEFHRSPIEKATGLLQQLEKKELWQKGEIKHYYSELTDIARTYIEEAIHIPAMESTTSELIAALRIAAVKKKMTLNQETLENLEKVLKHADLVKFAKVTPPNAEIAEDRKRIETSIVRIENAIPVVIEEESTDTFNEIIRQQKLKKKKRQRIFGVAGFILAFVIFFFIGATATRGIGFVKDFFFGDNAKELLEGEWISSEYGNPGIYVETPKVLKRTDAEKFLPKNAMALLKEFQMFVLNEDAARFSVIVSTASFKNPVQLELNKGIQGALQTLEARGAKNLIVKQEEYSTKQGISGMKAYGTATMPDPSTKQKIKIYYEILLFGQNNGAQQIIIIHEDGDESAVEITNRILNSVELKITGS